MEKSAHYRSWDNEGLAYGKTRGSGVRRVELVLREGPVVGGVAVRVDERAGDAVEGGAVVRLLQVRRQRPRPRLRVAVDRDGQLGVARVDPEGTLTRV